MVRFAFLLVLIIMMNSCGFPIPMQPKEISNHDLEEMIGSSKYSVIEQLGSPSLEVNLRKNNYLLYEGYGDAWGILFVLIWPVPIPPVGDFKHSELYCFLLKFNKGEILESFETRHLGTDCNWGCEDIDWPVFTSQKAIWTQLLDDENVGTFEVKGFPKIKITRQGSDETTFHNYYIKHTNDIPLKLPPGRYIVKFLPWCNLGETGELTFVCEAGHKYIYDYIDNRRGVGRVNAWIYDKTDEKIVSDVWISKCCKQTL